jgi:hypothetical protein
MVAICGLVPRENDRFAPPRPDSLSLAYTLRKLFVSFVPLLIMSSFEAANLFGVNGKVVLITGGSRGIGKMVCPEMSTNFLC